LVFNHVNGEWIPHGYMEPQECGLGLQSGFGKRIALSGDGQTLVVGAPHWSEDRYISGAVVVFRRTWDGHWIQDGQRIVPMDAVGHAEVGDAVSIDANGETIVFSGSEDKDPRFEGGAAWVYQRQLLPRLQR
jgi:hypothetical protein